MWNIQPSGRRVLLVRLESPITDVEQAAFGATLAGSVKATEGQVVLCTDLRGAVTFAPTVADRFVTMMRADNPKLLRSGFFVAGSATFGMQIERMIKEAGHANRRAFRDAPGLSAWLGEVVDPDEQAALATFLKA
jgi:hypothetical protein